MRRALFRWRRRLAVASAAACLLLLAAGALAYALTPLPRTLDAALAAPDTLVLDRHGALIADLPRGGIRHDVVPFSAFPLTLREATLAAEDISFYSNPGVDPVAIVRAALLDARLGRAAYGGSTITQQLVRDILLSPPERVSRSLWRKLHEALLALKLTRRLSKDAILALYLNTIGYGNLTYGAEAASRLYFGRSVADLDLAQAALLAGLPRAPSFYDPVRHPDAARQRRLVVLSLMRRHGFITARQERLAAAEPLRIGSVAQVGLAPHWVTYVLGLVSDKLGAARAEQGGLIIRTTLDLGIQQAAVAAVRRSIAAIAAAHQAHDAAVVAISPQSGQILAMVGSADPGNRAIDGAFNAALAPRQPGSAIKPFTYIAALDRWSPGSYGRATGHGYTEATLLDDVPTTFRAPDGALYQPMDYDAHFLGRVPLRIALGSSLNVPAVETLQRVGVARMVQVAHAAGITTLYRTDRYGQALTLGGGEVTLLDLTAAYGAIADGGVRHTPSAILGVTDTRGRALGDWTPAPPEQVFGPRGPQLAALMTDMLSDDSARLPAFGANSLLVLPGRPAAVKTGTTSDWHDNWTVGYTPDLVTGVWVGNADNTPMANISGITGAAPIWHDVMSSALRGVAPAAFALPPGMVRMTICQDTGRPATPSCRDAASALFVAGTAPVSDRSSVASRQPAAPGNASSLMPMITDPPDGAAFGLSPEIPAEAQRIAVTISYQHVADRFELLVDGRLAGRCEATAAQAPRNWGAAPRQQTCSVWWTLQPGRHRLEARAVAAGDRATHLNTDGQLIWITVHNN